MKCAICLKAIEQCLLRARYEKFIRAGNGCPRGRPRASWLQASGLCWRPIAPPPHLPAQAQLRSDISKELRIKEGAENMRRAVQDPNRRSAHDRRALAQLHTQIKSVNSRLQDLQQELADLDAQMLMASQFEFEDEQTTTGGGPGGGVGGVGGAGWRWRWRRQWASTPEDRPRPRRRPARRPRRRQERQLRHHHQRCAHLH